MLCVALSASVVCTKTAKVARVTPAMFFDDSGVESVQTHAPYTQLTTVDY
jgi:hypothetical protein